MALTGKQQENRQPVLPGSEPERIPIEDEFALYSVRSAALRRARRLGMPEPGIGELEIIIRELVQNVLVHGGGKGQVVISHLSEKGGHSLLLDVFDRGKGFENIDLALRDGYTTSGGLGGGLPAVRRFSDRFEILNPGPGGTHLRAVKHIRKRPDPEYGWSFTLLTRPRPGESVCGDKGAIIHDADRLTVILADGLGHGPLAAEAAERAVHHVKTNARVPLEELVPMLDGELRDTRGAAVSIARILPSQHAIHWLGIGNVRGCLLPPAQSHERQTITFTNFNGTVGASPERFKVLTYSYRAGDWMVLTSDGIKSRWPEGATRLEKHDIFSLGKLLLDEAARPRDDASVLVGRAVR